MLCLVATERAGKDSVGLVHDKDGITHTVILQPHPQPIDGTSEGGEHGNQLPAPELGQVGRDCKQCSQCLFPAQVPASGQASKQTLRLMDGVE